MRKHAVIIVVILLFLGVGIFWLIQDGAKKNTEQKKQVFVEQDFPIGAIVYSNGEMSRRRVVFKTQTKAELRFYNESEETIRLKSIKNPEGATHFPYESRELPPHMVTHIALFMPGTYVFSLVSDSQKQFSVEVIR